MASSLGAATSMEMLRGKFRGAMLGALIGDCMGVVFESAERPRPLDLAKVAEYFARFRPTEDSHFPKPSILNYTDDTAMTKVLADSLCRKKKVDVKDLAEKFTTEYFSEKERGVDRGYGFHVRHVFVELKSNPEDVLKPAQAQFNGTGSYGNGAAMRVTPVALFYHKNTQKMIASCKDSALVTHTHIDGYSGAILLCLAIQEALKADPQTPVDPIPFIERLEEEMKQLQPTPSPYSEQLNKMKNLLSQPEPPSIKKVVAELGNNVSALKSVPTAIYSFLRAQQHPEEPIREFTAPNQYERTIQYAISLGGDTDTIGCMAGACCGAHVGEEVIPLYLIETCEDHDKVMDLADKLLEAMQQSEAN